MQFLQGVNPITGTPASRAEAGSQLWDAIKNNAKVQLRTYDTSSSSGGVNIDAVVAGGGVNVDSTGSDLTSAQDYLRASASWTPRRATRDAAARDDLRARTVLAGCGGGGRLVVVGSDGVRAVGLQDDERAGLLVRLPVELGDAGRHRGWRGRPGPEGHRRARPAGGGRARRGDGGPRELVDGFIANNRIRRAGWKVVKDEDYKLDGAKDAHLIEATYDEVTGSTATTPVRTIDVLVQTDKGVALDLFLRAPDADFDNARLREVLDTFRLQVTLVPPAARGPLAGLLAFGLALLLLGGLLGPLSADWNQSVAIAVGAIAAAVGGAIGGLAGAWQARAAGQRGGPLLLGAALGPVMGAVLLIASAPEASMATLVGLLAVAAGAVGAASLAVALSSVGR